MINVSDTFVNHSNNFVVGIMSFFRAVKDLQYTVAEVKVREATSNDAWGPEIALMREIATLTYRRDDYPKLFAMVYKRVTDIDHVMHVQKCLILIHFLINHGSNRFLKDCKKKSFTTS